VEDSGGHGTSFGLWALGFGLWTPLAIRGGILLRKLNILVFAFLAVGNAVELAFADRMGWRAAWDALGMAFGVGGLLWIWVKKPAFDTGPARPQTLNLTESSDSK
jgi:hypothetical protein